MNAKPLDQRDVAGRVREYLSTEVILDDTIDLTDDTPLLAGVLDSLGLMDLVSFLEDEFEIALEPSDIEPAHFRSVGDIARLVVDRSQRPA